MSAPIRLERDGAVAAMVLDSPPLNLFGAAAFEALNECLDEVTGSDARALVWRAEGKLFTGGADVNVFQQIVDAGGDRADLSFDPLLGAVRRLEALPIPTLALVHGLCLTAGLEVSLGCDMIWAGESARFGLVEAVVGLTPGAGGTQRMAERAGPSRAREFVMSQGIYDATTLEGWGVVNRVLPDDELLEKGMRFAQRLAAGPDQGARGDQADRPRLSRGRRRRGRPGDARGRGLPVRDRGPEAGGQVVPRGGPGQGDLRGPLASHPPIRSRR